MPCPRPCRLPVRAQAMAIALALCAGLAPAPAAAMPDPDDPPPLTPIRDPAPVDPQPPQVVLALATPPQPVTPGA